MMPPPMISMFLGTPGSASAPVESTTRGSSGKKGRRTACEPTAMMQALKDTTCLLPVCSWPLPWVASICTWCGPTKAP